MRLVIEGNVVQCSCLFGLNCAHLNVIALQAFGVAIWRTGALKCSGNVLEFSTLCCVLLLHGFVLQIVRMYLYIYTRERVRVSRSVWLLPLLCSRRCYTLLVWRHVLYQPLHASVTLWETEMKAYLCRFEFITAPKSALSGPLRRVLSCFIVHSAVKHSRIGIHHVSQLLHLVHMHMNIQNAYF